MKELNMAWELLKMGEDYGDVSVALDQRAEEERARKDAIERHNAMARKRLMEQAQYPNMALQRGDDPKQVAMQHPSVEAITGKGKTKVAHEAYKEMLRRRGINLDDEDEKIEFPNLMTDSPERIRELAPNANLVDSNAPPVPQTDPNPLGLSMDKLKELQRQG